MAHNPSGSPGTQTIQFAKFALAKSSPLMDPPLLAPVYSPRQSSLAYFFAIHETDCPN